MGAPNILNTLKGMGLRLSAHGDSIRVEPLELMTEAARALILQHKSSLLELLCDDWGYSLADLSAMDVLNNRLCDALDLSGEERAARLKARRCMAPVRIPGELAALRKVVPATEARRGSP
jgi:hypothetical protein